MLSPFGVRVALEHKNVEPGTGTLWGSITIEAQGPTLEAERAPLAVALVVDRSGSMAGEPLEKVLRSCEAIASHLLGPADQLAIVAFSTHASILCGLTDVDEEGCVRLRRSLRGVSAHGDTHLSEGIGVAASVLQQARVGLRRVVVVLSDGQPNQGLRSASQLADYVGSLGMGVSALGFGANYDENVLDAIASAGSGRYAYINDPSLARVDLARAVLAQAGIVADHIEIKLQPCAGVEVLQMLPASQRRFGADGVTTSVGDVFKDEARSFAVEFRLDLQSGASGRLADVVVEGRGPGGVEHSVAARFEIDIRSGARVVDPVGAREVLTVQADAARAVARVQADRREMVAAAATLREVIVRIDALEGFVKNDGSMLAELREELADQAARCERRSTNSERCHQRKSELAYKTGAPFYSRPVRQEPPIRAQLVGVEGPVRGRVFRLWTETLIGRSSRCDVTVEHESMSRNHARVQFLDDHFLLVDLGATTGTTLNAAPIQSARLANGDVIRMGDAVWRFEISDRQASLPGI